MSVHATASTSWPVSGNVADALLDTGVWYAVLDRRDRDHHRCVEAMETVAGRLVSTEAVLTETIWLLEELPNGLRGCAEFVRRGAVTLVPVSAEGLERAVELMLRYRNVPMDYADASLVTAGEDLDLDTVLTLDRRGFGVYRLHGRRPFRIIP